MVVALFSSCSVEAPEDVDFYSFEEKLVLLLRDDLLFLTLAFLESNDAIYMTLGRYIMFNILKGIEIFSRPSIPQESLLFFGSLVVFGVIVRLSVSKSYWVASEMKTEFWTPGALSSSYISFSLP